MVVTQDQFAEVRYELGGLKDKVGGLEIEVGEMRSALSAMGTEFGGAQVKLIG